MDSKNPYLQLYRRRLFLFGLLSIVLIFSASLAVKIHYIEEEVDLSRLKEAKIRISIDVDYSYGLTLTQKTLHSLCLQHFPTVLKCDVEKISKATITTVQFTITEVPLLRVEDFELDNNNAKVKFGFEYFPKQFVFSKGYEIESKRLVIKYPTHKTIIDDVEQKIFDSTFTIFSEYETKDDLDLKSSEFILGKLINIPKTAGDLCIVGLLRDDMESPPYKELFFECKGMVITSSADITLTSEDGETSKLVSGIKIGDYSVVRINFKSGKIIVSKTKLKFNPNDIAIHLTPSKGRVYLGETFYLDVESRFHLDSCQLELRDVDDNKVDSVSISLCDNIPIGTSTSWMPGMYSLLFTGHHEDDLGYASTVIEFRGQGYNSAEVTTDKDIYSAGEDVSLFINAKGEYCQTELLDRDYVKVGEVETGGCDYSKLVLDESLKNGKYLIKTKVYSGGRLSAIAAKVIEIKEWQEIEKSQKSDLCDNGFIHLNQHSLNCISTYESCVPSSTSTPMCLCFDKDGFAKEVCKYGQVCGVDGCEDTSRMKSIYLIINTAQGCLAKHGVETLRCLHFGELCTGNCVCVNDKTDILSSCTVGNVCTYTGCIEQNLEFELVSMSPDHFRNDELGKGTSSIVWTGFIKLNQKIKNYEIIDDLVINGGLIVDGRRIKAQSGDIKKTFISEEKGWQFETPLDVFLGPDLYDAYIEVRYTGPIYNGQIHVIRRPFEVWYPQKEKDLTIHIKDIVPRKISARSLQYGATARITAQILDSKGENIVYLPADAFKVEISDLEAFSLAALYDPLSGNWKISPNFRDDKSPEGDFLTLKVNHLGRTGTAKDNFEVLRTVPLNLIISRIHPGTKDLPLYSAQTSVGFDLDVYMQIESDSQVKRENFKIKVGKHDVSTKIKYLTSTVEGIKVHLSDIILCPPPEPDSIIPIEVSLISGEETVEDSISIRVKGNPGNWEDRRAQTCQ